jgi:hypothetical protein
LKASDKMFASGKSTIAPEAEMVLCLCRPHPAQTQLDRALQLARDALDWGRIVEHAVRHRVLPAVMENASVLGIRYPERFRQLARAVMLYNGARAEAFRREYSKLRSSFKSAELITLPRKGIYLGWALYPDPSWRSMNDIDLFIRSSATEDVRRIMHEFGYMQGTISSDYRRITPITREVEAFWLVNAGSMPAFLRSVCDPALDFSSVDLRYNILEPAMGKKFDMEQVFDRARVDWLHGEETLLASREDFFIDVCVHLYREAITLTSIESGKDIRLCKFADVAELLAATQQAPDQDLLLEICEHSDLKREMYFALWQTAELLTDSVPPELLRAFTPDDYGYLDQYGTVDRQTATWSDPIAVRAFDYTRAGRLQARSALPRS